MLIQTTVLIASFAAPFDFGPSEVWLFDNYGQCSAAINTFAAIDGVKVEALTCQEIVPLSPLAPRTSPAPRARPEKGE